VEDPRRALSELGSSLRDRKSDTNYDSVELLLTDLDVAMTFLDVAETSKIPETVTRNHTNARVAYDSGSRLPCQAETGRSATASDRWQAVAIEGAPGGDWPDLLKHNDRSGH
jgi:hypothetical protein